MNLDARQLRVLFSEKTQKNINRWFAGSGLTTGIYYPYVFDVLY